MDDLVMKKLERLHFVLLRIEAQEQLEKLIEQLDNEIAAEHGVQWTAGTYCDCPMDKRAYFNGICKTCGKLCRK